MGIYDRDYYRETSKKIVKRDAQKKIFVWLIIIILILGLILNLIPFR